MEVPFLINIQYSWDQSTIIFCTHILRANSSETKLYQLQIVTVAVLVWTSGLTLTCFHLRRTCCVRFVSTYYVMASSESFWGQVRVIWRLSALLLSVSHNPFINALKRKPYLPLLNWTVPCAMPCNIQLYIWYRLHSWCKKLTSKSVQKLWRTLYGQ